MCNPDLRNENAILYVWPFPIDVCTNVAYLQLQAVLSLFQCSAGVGVDAFFHALYTRKSSRTIALIGTGCSEVTEHLAQIVPYWNILQVRRTD